MIDRSKRSSILNEVHLEMEHQRKMWGIQDYAPPEWLMILGEEVGEASKGALEAHFPAYLKYGDFSDYRRELIQVAAVALQAVESYDRQKEYKNADSKHSL
jgi:hypothetical protein